MKAVLSVILVVFVSVSCASAGEKVKLPDYKKWHRKDLKFAYATMRDGCNNVTVEELFDESLYVNLKAEQYDPGTFLGFVDIIKDKNGKPWLLVYYKDETMYLFRQKGLFRNRWEHTDTLRMQEDEDHELFVLKVATFQSKNCLWFGVF